MSPALCIVIFTTLLLPAATPQYVPKYQNDPHEAVKNRNNLRSEVVQLLNDQVSNEMTASLVYMSMASHFNSEKHDRPGFAKFFRKASEEEREHAMKISDYLNKRGTSLTSMSVQMPTVYSWDNGLLALQDALALENRVTDQLMQIHENATKVGDGSLTDFLESEFLEEQIDSIRQLRRYINTLEYMMHSHKQRHENKQGMLAEYMFDLQLQGKECSAAII